MNNTSGFKRDLGVQQCFGVVYHELTTLRWVYFARAALALAARAKNDEYIVESFSTTEQRYYELTTLCACTSGIRELLIPKLITGFSNKELC